MKDYLFDAREELKRADHMLYVSLKYTRTVDVIRNIIERLISALDFVITGMLNKKKEAGKIREIPEQPGVRAELAKKLYADAKIQDTMQFYLLLRKIVRAEFTRSKEFRKHVTMTAMIDSQYMEIKVDTVHEYFSRTKEFADYVEGMIR